MVPAAVYALALLPAVLWGFSPILSTRGMAGGGSSPQAALVGVVVESLVYWTALLAPERGEPFDIVDTAALVIVVVAGLVGTALVRIATIAGVHRVGARVNAVAISVRPLFATVIALAWLGEPMDLMTAPGVVVLVAGLLVLTTSRGGDLSGWMGRDLLSPLPAALAFAVGNVVRRFGLTTTEVTTLQAGTLDETADLVALILATDRREAVTGAP